MTAIDDLKTRFGRAWDTVAEGWHELVERTGDALTRFYPGTSEEQSSRGATEAVRWGMLAADVVTRDDTVEVSVEIPGMNREDFDIHVEGQTLFIHGEKSMERERTEGRFHVRERAYGSFRRTVALPVAAQDTGATATYRRGVLHVTVPRAKTGQTRRIEVMG